jgi:hypothetical protein
MTETSAPASEEALKIYSPRAINSEPEQADGFNSPRAINSEEEPTDQSYSPRAINEEAKSKRPRRTKATMKGIRDAIFELLEESNPQTVRQVYYALTVRGLIGKTQKEYKQTVVRLLVDLREDGTIPFDWITDSTRLMRKRTAFTGIAHALDHWAKAYRRDLWAASPVYVEIWCEKDALTGVLFEETDVYDVPLMPARGYSSLTFLHSAAKTIEAYGKPAHIYHFGDLDPSGQDAARDIEAKLRRYAPEAEIHFTRVAVTRQQVDEWSLPGRPTKTEDPRSKKWEGNSVELDAIPAQQLRSLVKDCIERHIDRQQLEILRISEESERELLVKWGSAYGGQS